MSKDILGRKIIDLIEENRMQIRENEEVVEIEIEKIHANPNQPRKKFNQKTLKELSESITSHGVLQPIIVKPTLEGYITVAGERRVRASLIANKKTIPAIIRDYNSIMLAELAILENIQREDLNPIEEAIAYENVLKASNITHAELGNRIGKSRSYVTNIIGLLNLPESVIQEVVNKRITLGHAKVLSKLKNHDRVVDLTNKIIRKGLTVRQLENMIKKSNKSVSKRAETFTLDNEIISFFRDYFDKDVSLSEHKKEIRVRFKNQNHKNKCLEALRGKVEDNHKS